jgi:hypothetical protein
MEIGTIPARFLDIDTININDFLEIYSNSTEPKYIMELINDETTNFKLFFDFDYVGETALDNNYIFEIAKVLIDTIKTIKIYNNFNLKHIYITGATSIIQSNIKTGIHFKCDEIILNCKKALEIRELFVKKLTIFNNKINWNLVIDKEVYSPNKGIRMFGSRKVKKGIDVGRVHEYIGRISFDEVVNNEKLDGIELLKKLSIKT